MLERVEFMTNHAAEDRVDRLAKICMTIGVGNVKYELQDRNRNARLCITDTGVALIKALDADVLITAYILGLSKATAMFRNNGYDKIPADIYKVICRNEKNGRLKKIR